MISRLAMTNPSLTIRVVNLHSRRRRRNIRTRIREYMFNELSRILMISSFGTSKTTGFTCVLCVTNPIIHKSKMKKEEDDKFSFADGKSLRGHLLTQHLKKDPNVDKAVVDVTNAVLDSFPKEVKGERHRLSVQSGITEAMRRIGLIANARREKERQEVNLKRGNPYPPHHDDHAPERQHTT
jgi:hypothetical protein